MKVRTRKLAVFVTCLGLAAAFPVLSSADKGGVPHSQKPCKVKKKAKKHPAHNNKGKKCGFNTTIGTTTVAAPTGTETETETQTSTVTSTS